MIYTLTTNVSVVAAGTPVRLSSTQVLCQWFTVSAPSNNAGDVYVGGCDPSSKQAAGVLASAKRGIRLTAGSSMTFLAAAATLPYDLHETWLDADTSADKVSVTYLR